MAIFSIAKHATVRWPAICAECGSTPTVRAIASESGVTGLSYVLIAMRLNITTVSLPYPLCPRHFRVSKLLRLVVAAGALAIVAALIIAIVAKNPWSYVLAGLLGITGIWAFVRPAQWAPVRIRTGLGEHIVFEIANQAYAEQFSRLNQTMVRLIKMGESPTGKPSTAYKLGQFVGSMLKRR